MELYETLHDRLPGAPPMLTDFEREVIFRRAALDAAARGTPAPFRLRPGLIVEILAFYDELRRRDKTVAAFERLMAESLEPSAEIDRGADRLLRLTRFLCSAFEIFERRIGESRGVDEHGLRALLIETAGAGPGVRPHEPPGGDPGVRPQSLDQPLTGDRAQQTDLHVGPIIGVSPHPLSAPPDQGHRIGVRPQEPTTGVRPQGAPYRHIVVTVPDQAADPHGLWMADYDLLARMPGLERLDIIATENVLAAGFHERVHDVLPGIEEERIGTPAPLPCCPLPSPPSAATPIGWFVCRDREEELVEVARAIKGGPRPARPHRRGLPASAAVPLSRAAGVSRRRVPYQALDALPLAAEPFAAALDLVFVVRHRGRHARVAWSISWRRRTGVRGGWTHRRATRRRGARRAVARREVSRRLGSPASRLQRRSTRIGAAPPGVGGLAAPPLRLRPSSARRSTRPRRRSSCRRCSSSSPRTSGGPRPADEWYARHLRARAAILGAARVARATRMPARRRAARDRGAGRRRPPVDRRADVLAAHRHARTDAPRRAGGRLRRRRRDAPSSVSSRATGPIAARRSIFYPSSLLTQLGWPNETDRLAAARARFHDLLRAAAPGVSRSRRFTLEDDAIVSASSFLEELEAAGCRSSGATAPPDHACSSRKRWPTIRSCLPR